MFACLLKCCQINFCSAVPYRPLKRSLRVYVCLTCTCYPIVLSRIYVLCIFIVPAEPNSYPPPPLCCSLRHWKASSLHCSIKSQRTQLASAQLDIRCYFPLFLYTYIRTCVCVCLYVSLFACLSFWLLAYLICAFKHFKQAATAAAVDALSHFLPLPTHSLSLLLSSARLLLLPALHCRRHQQQRRLIANSL